MASISVDLGTIVTAIEIAVKIVKTVKDSREAKAEYESLVTLLRGLHCVGEQIEELGKLPGKEALFRGLKLSLEPLKGPIAELVGIVRSFESCFDPPPNTVVISKEVRKIDWIVRTASRVGKYRQEILLLMQPIQLMLAAENWYVPVLPFVPTDPKYSKTLHSGMQAMQKSLDTSIAKQTSSSLVFETALTEIKAAPGLINDTLSAALSQKKIDFLGQTFLPCSAHILELEKEEALPADGPFKTCLGVLLLYELV